MWTTTSTSRQRFSSQSNMSSGATKSPIGCLAMLRHLPSSASRRRSQTTTSSVAVLGQLGDDVGADEAGAAGDEGDAALGHARRLSSWRWPRWWNSPRRWSPASPRRPSP